MTNLTTILAHVIGYEAHASGGRILTFWQADAATPRACYVSAVVATQLGPVQPDQMWQLHLVGAVVVAGEQTEVAMVVLQEAA